MEPAPRRERRRGRPDANYAFDKADVVVALDSDFPLTGPGSVRYSRDFAKQALIDDVDDQGHVMGT